MILSKAPYHYFKIGLIFGLVALISIVSLAVFEFKIHGTGFALSITTFLASGVIAGIYFFITLISLVIRKVRLSKLEH